MLLSNFYLEIHFWYYFTAFPRLTQSWKFTELSFSGSKWWNLPPVEPLITIYNCLKFLKKNGWKDCLPSLKMSLPNMLKGQHCDNEREKWCSCHILKSCAIYYWTDTWQNGIQKKMFSSCHEHGTKKRFWVSTKNDIHNVLVHHRIPMAQW